MILLLMNSTELMLASSSGLNLGRGKEGLVSTDVRYIFYII